MNSAIETELRTLLDNVNKTLALNMSTKHGLDYDEVYEFLTVSMNENKAPSSRGRPKKEKKTITENHKDSTGKPDVNYIIKEIMEKDAELELSEDEIDGDAGEETSVLASSPKKVEKTEKKKEKPKVEKTEKPKVEKDDEKEKPKVEKEEQKEKPKAEKEEQKEKTKAEKAKTEKAEAAEKAKAEKAEAAEKAKAEKAQAAEKAKAEKAAAKSATAEKKPKGKGKGKEKEKTEDVVEASAADTDADEDDDDAGMNVCEHIVDGKTYLREEFGTKLYDPETNEEIGDWDEKNNKIIKA